MAGVQDGFIIVLRTLVQAVATGLAVSHLQEKQKRCCFYQAADSSSMLHIQYS